MNATERNVYRLQCSNEDLCAALRKIVELDTHQDEEDSEPYLGKLGQIASKALKRKVNYEPPVRSG